MSEIVNFKSRKSKRSDSARNESASAAVDPRQYSPDEVSDIIRVALKDVDNEAKDSVIHSELLSIGQEFGLQEDDIERAYESLLDERDMQQLKSQLRSQFKIVSVVLLVIFCGFIAIDVFLVPESNSIIYVIPGFAFTLIFSFLQLKYVPKLVNSVFDFSSNLDAGSVAAFNTRGLYMSKYGIAMVSWGVHIEKGLLRIKGDNLVMEYRKTDHFGGLIKSKVKEIEIPLKEIVSVRLERQFWMSKLILQSDSLKTFEDVPGESDGYLKLTFNPRARVAVHNLARDIEDRIASSS